MSMCFDILTGAHTAPSVHTTHYRSLTLITLQALRWAFYMLTAYFVSRQLGGHR